MAVTAKRLKRRTYSAGPKGGNDRRPRNAVTPTRDLAKDLQAARGRRTRKSPRSANAAAARRAQVLSSVQLIGSILLIFAMACGVVAGRAMVADLGYELVRLESQLEEARGYTDTLSSRVAALQDPERIALAAEDMGMVPASSAADPGEDNAPSVAIIASTTGSTSSPAVTRARHEDSRVPSFDRPPSRIVLELEDTTEPTVQLADFRGLGDWVLRWLKGPTPVEAHN